MQFALVTELTSLFRSFIFILTSSPRHPRKHCRWDAISRCRRATDARPLFSLLKLQPSSPEVAPPPHPPPHPAVADEGEPLSPCELSRLLSLFPAAFHIHSLTNISVFFLQFSAAPNLISPAARADGVSEADIASINDGAPSSPPTVQLLSKYSLETLAAGRNQDSHAAGTV